MAGRKSSSSFGDLFRTIVLCLLLLIGALLFISGFLALVLWPLFFLFMYLKKASGKNDFLTVEPAPQSFWLNAEEKIHFRKMFEALSSAKRSLVQQIDILNALPEARFNKDGSYDKRSEAGKDREDQRSYVFFEKSKVAQYELELTELSKKPVETFNLWSDKIVKYKAFEFTVCFILLCIPFYEAIVLTSLGYAREVLLNAYIFYALTAPLQLIDSLISIQEYFPFFFAQDYAGFDFSWKHWMVVMIVPPFLPIIPYLAAFTFYSNRMAAQEKAPPEVSIENIEEY